MQIRTMNKKDLKRLAQIYVEVYTKFDVGERWTEEAAYNLLKHYYNRQPDLAFVADLDGKSVGAFIACIKPWWDGNHLSEGEIFVHPDYQAKGVGSKLSEVMFETAIEKYDATVWDTITFKGKYPEKWYKKLGFVPIKEWSLISGDMREALKRIMK